MTGTLYTKDASPAPYLVSDRTDVVGRGSPRLPWSSQWLQDAERPLDAILQATPRAANDISIEVYQSANAKRGSGSEAFSPADVANALLVRAPSCSIPEVGTWVLRAEDCQFSRSVSASLSSWLIDFAVSHRDDSVCNSETFVWSAIRTAASMSAANDSEALLPLLEPGHGVETSLVTLKMLGRIYEAYPPAETGHGTPGVHAKVWEIVDATLNRHVVDESRGAAKAILAIVALAGLASPKLLDVAGRISALRMPWFARRVRRKLVSLLEAWCHKANPKVTAMVRCAVERLGA